MILDSLENSKRIECIHPLFKQAFDYVKSTDFSKMEDGKYDIADAGFTVSIASLFGKEKIGWKPGDQLLEESVPYNEEQDIAFYIDKPTAYTKIYPGQFAIYFPEDGHAPGIGQGNIRKVVIKIPVQ